MPDPVVQKMKRTLISRMVSPDALPDPTPQPPEDPTPPVPAPEVVPTPTALPDDDEALHDEEPDTIGMTPGEIAIRNKQRREAEEAEAKRKAEEEAESKVKAEAEANGSPPNPDPKNEEQPKPAEKKQAKVKKPEKSEPLTVNDEDFSKQPQEPSEPVDLTTVLEDVGYTPASDEEDEYIELLHWAEQTGEKKFAGAVRKEAERLKKAQDFIAQWNEQNPGDTFDPRTAELEDGTKFKSIGTPLIDMATQRKLDRKRIREEAARDADARISKAQAEQERRLKAIEAKPDIDKAVGSVDSDLLADIVLDEDADINGALVKALNDGGIDAISEDMPIESRIISRHMGETKGMVKAMLEITRGVRSIDTNSATDVAVLEFVDEASNFFAEHGGDLRIRGGKTFLTPGRFAALKADARGKYWTFSDTDMVDMIKASSVKKLGIELQNERNILKKREAGRAKFRKPEPKKEPTVINDTPPEPMPAAPKISPSPRSGAKSPQSKKPARVGLVARMTGGVQP